MNIKVKEDHTDEIIAAVKAASERALEMCGLQAEGYAKRKYSPVDTGNLRNSITHGVEDDTAYIGTNVEYAPYQEFGTSRMKPHPFLKPAVQNHTDEYRSIIKSCLENA